MAEELSTPTPLPLTAGSASQLSQRPEPVNPTTLEEEAKEPGAAPSSSDPKAELRAIAQTGNQNRLSPSEEDKATRLMRECILGGSEGVVVALEAMPQLPWILGVRAIESAWPGLAGDLRAQVLDGLAKMETDNGYRLRLSVARGLANVELPAAVQIAAGACSGMWNKETGSLSPEHSKLIGNVFIGRGKPWVLQLPLAESEEAGADPVVASVVFSAFNINNPPITQLSILRYAADRLGGLHENVLGMVVRGVGRWNGKWQSALRKEIPSLPAAILAVLKPERGAGPAVANEAPGPVAGASAEEEVEAALPPELEERFKLASESGDGEAVEAATREINTWREAQRIARLEALDEEEEEDEDENEENEGGEAGDAARSGEPRDRRGRRGRDRRDRPAYVSREQEAKGTAGSSYNALIKQLDAYVTGLRADLTAAQARLRRTEDEGRRTRADRPLLSPEEANLSPDELKRLVIQLENRIVELQARLEELTADSETRALAMAAGTPDASPDAVTQLRTLLALKLQDDYADFLVLDKESPDAVVQQHYRGLIRHVFEVLQGEQVPLRVPEEPAVVPPLPPPNLS